MKELRRFIQEERFYSDEGSYTSISAPSASDDFPPSDRVIVTRADIAAAEFQQTGRLTVGHRDTRENRDTKLQYRLPLELTAYALSLYDQVFGRFDIGTRVTLADLDQAMAAPVSK